MMISQVKQLAERISLFRQYHQGTNPRPVIGFCIGGWEGFKRYVPDAAGFFPIGKKLDHRGLCLQFVVETIGEADEILQSMRQLFG